MEPITAEAVFDKYATASKLPARKTDEALADYITRVGTTDEITRRLQGAVDAARVADHAECAHWASQASEALTPRWKN
ncbi:MAG: hypothetical protein LAO77_23220 [Acidobacteriia bacterium]|nr:hypothetical protein [Terriglobia bacterium]